ncbi:hypothetical protein SPRG_11206 [Saprolegnia parasitica CBS 223.65]|uniref:Reverse transcriptase zinc-binding domain-containing protein n=1 Tax=Saprolegnia parasitica (strain CBS 223.65) TaxID=695850 RepID=A0A067C2C3_SAPPC|nr:hypothetical protein SPRG_11206 [Saprolegnia parasitica CBS 223.65]KDO23275.1 hypothetical protein SPRG_11206 [Saprolegnia parasitica CBS 223.65]|eukprot:XP_012206060.1 hypothetical protein SPRG_11206 [Saprolegnia parasitica CBS 223.65]
MAQPSIDQYESAQWIGSKPPFHAHTCGGGRRHVSSARPHSTALRLIKLGAVVARTQLYFLGDDAQGCPVCGAPETYERLLGCEFVSTVWAVFRPLVDALELELPSTLSALLFEPLLVSAPHRLARLKRPSLPSRGA